MTDTTDRALLHALSGGHFISGEQLAHQCGISRTAVWKRLQNFNQRWGLDIHSVRGKGYRLSRAIELLEEEILATEHPDTNVAPQVHLSLPSTSASLLEQLQQGGLENGASVFAEHQSAGRGRRGREWISPFASNIYCSIHWRFDCGFAELGALSLAVGAILCRLLDEYGVADVGLKWPNDILVERRKLAGILVDLLGSSEGPVDAVIGIGLNFSMPGNADELIDQPWTDLESLGMGELSRNRIASDLVHALTSGLPEYAHSGFHAFVDDWRRFDTLLGSPVTVVMGDNRIQGIHAGISTDGALVLENNGEKRRYYSGEVSLRGTGSAGDGNA
ncbi:bifunctional biotin--[acetyl-CoA-carboxylase] ligase/biotin operon repressor BirA [Solemya velum gill symbiont]|uniref:Bifunctional ligase/repressor BirA n=1 Tax=Solemya velum gill symbiont TaxID=2340 RepID=A0A0B0H4W2_SOVGS|nr:bifunctional biotin--[acetyl-CoA-carboxylase] ligase/biotin operon repressor BirA [Solemya velum gill symbiont]KHF24175.1 BirA [Solemya velum gill symbiont]OOY36084.1 biotin--[acetyl-CoA-carboxylase] ligase [Solemya velum gill symbiont]OOY38209.1 biotin--[acetyl-CoA-carboxylase] ligase [Solemya velum gill symbiont]OOY39541.1 biotin--[acetyl-CoA-carboxylase] ligase [Solemya velum gill symbiont]OOY42506.1 biotin--[acetyl-CoA-carboxylase] ligase [Solemya velum gill symbiont]